MPTVPLSEMLNLEGKTVIVTGAAKGIGRGIAERFAEAGAKVIVSDIDAEAGQATAAALNGEFVSANMASEDDILRLFSQAGNVDILVNNAGIYPFKPVLELTADEWDRVQSINLRGLFLASREFARAAKQRNSGGVIVNIGSIDSFHPSMVGLAAYDASKGGVLLLTRSMALELAPLGIRVNMIAPGAIVTEGTGTALDEAAMNAFIARIPLGRMGVPDDIATMALVLATPLSAYVTGAAFVVDGGRLLT